MRRSDFPAFWPVGVKSQPKSVVVLPCYLVIWHVIGIEFVWKGSKLKISFYLRSKLQSQSSFKPLESVFFLTANVPTFRWSDLWSTQRYTCKSLLLGDRLATSITSFSRQRKFIILNDAAAVFVLLCHFAFQANHRPAGGVAAALQPYAARPKGRYVLERRGTRVKRLF